MAEEKKEVKKPKFRLVLKDHRILNFLGCVEDAVNVKVTKFPETVYFTIMDPAKLSAVVVEIPSIAADELLVEEEGAAEIAYPENFNFGKMPAKPKEIIIESDGKNISMQFRGETKVTSILLEVGKETVELIDGLINFPIRREYKAEVALLSQQFASMIRRAVGYAKGKNAYPAFTFIITEGEFTIRGARPDTLTYSETFGLVDVIELAVYATPPVHVTPATPLDEEIYRFANIAQRAFRDYTVKLLFKTGGPLLITISPYGARVDLIIAGTETPKEVLEYAVERKEPIGRVEYWDDNAKDFVKVLESVLQYEYGAYLYASPKELRIGTGGVEGGLAYATWYWESEDADEIETPSETKVYELTTSIRKALFDTLRKSHKVKVLLYPDSAVITGDDVPVFEFRIPPEKFEVAEPPERKTTLAIVETNILMDIIEDAKTIDAKWVAIHTKPTPGATFPVKSKETITYEAEIPYIDQYEEGFFVIANHMYDILKRFLTAFKGDVVTLYTYKESLMAISGLSPHKHYAIAWWPVDLKTIEEVKNEFLKPPEKSPEKPPVVEEEAEKKRDEARRLLEECRRYLEEELNKRYGEISEEFSRLEEEIRRVEEKPSLETIESLAEKLESLKEDVASLKLRVEYARKRIGDYRNTIFKTLN
ncbi:MAG: hypothetical protein DRJ59_07630, partial [Thermoprotei archaeon]